MNKLPCTLIVDDDRDAAQSLGRALTANNLPSSIELAFKTSTALKLIKDKQPEVLVLDLNLDPKLGVTSGFTVLKKTRSLAKHCRTIVLTGHGDIEYGIYALQLGAASFIEKPAQVDHLSALIHDGIQQARIKASYFHNNKNLKNNLSSVLIGNSTVIENLRNEIIYAAQNDQAVLLIGETGTGKGLCAKCIHDLSLRKYQHFVRYQAFSSTTELATSELFGHRKGAFTGADQDRIGLIKRAHLGSLFLDEIDQLPQQIQVSLLGTLQDQSFRALGSDQEQFSDFRLISATNCDLAKTLEDNKLREDFFHRISHLKILIPPLRERLSDMYQLIQYILKRLEHRANLNVTEFKQSTVDKLTNYEWPGNIRELEAVVENAAYRCKYAGKFSIGPEHVQLSSSSNVAKNLSFHKQVQQYKKQIVEKQLLICDNNQVQAAKHLEIDRSTLRRILMS